MSLANISLSRPIGSYSKVQKLVGNLIRNRRFQLRRAEAKLNGLRYVDIGCGPNTHSNFINLDFLWNPKIDVCWDITRGLPFPDSCIHGIFTEHCLEHFSLSTAVEILKECRRILRPGGTLRVVVPDGELYLRIYNSQIRDEDCPKFPYQDNEAFSGIFSPILSVNRIFYQDRDSPYGHRFIYDAHFLRLLLRNCGFDWSEQVEFRKGRNADLLIDTELRRCESLYVEAGVTCGAEL